MVETIQCLKHDPRPKTKGAKKRESVNEIAKDFGDVWRSPHGLIRRFWGVLPMVARLPEVGLAFRIIMTFFFIVLVFW